MTPLFFATRVLPLMAALVLAGCATSPPSIDPSSLPVTPTLFRQSQAVAAAPSAPYQAQWWTVFADPVLDRLVAAASRRNHNLSASAARPAQARRCAQPWAWRCSPG